MKSENLHLSIAPTRSALLATLHSLQETFGSWQRRARGRDELAHLDTWSQRDLGLSEQDVQHEASKPRWSA
ncbi:MAG TPA: DUF1127 domain-containing protein [Polyangiales bacterium]|nr:DUF1127 domain-containing protein [Polyangiales bacterium]